MSLPSLQCIWNSIYATYTSPHVPLSGLRSSSVGEQTEDVWTSVRGMFAFRPIIPNSSKKNPKSKNHSCFLTVFGVILEPLSPIKMFPHTSATLARNLFAILHLVLFSARTTIASILTPKLLRQAFVGTSVEWLRGCFHSNHHLHWCVCSGVTFKCVVIQFQNNSQHHHRDGCCSL